MALKNQPERMWEKDGWELWMKQQRGYIELDVKRVQKDFRIHSGRMGEHGIHVRFKQENRNEELERRSQSRTGWRQTRR
jgi:hypothetical protein